MVSVIVHEKLLFQENEGVLMLSVLLMLEDMHFVCQSDRCAWNSSELVSFSCLSHITSSFVLASAIVCRARDKTKMRITRRFQFLIEMIVCIIFYGRGFFGYSGPGQLVAGRMEGSVWTLHKQHLTKEL